MSDDIIPETLKKENMKKTAKRKFFVLAVFTFPTKYYMSYTQFRLFARRLCICSPKTAASTALMIAVGMNGSTHAVNPVITDAFIKIQYMITPTT